MGIDDNEAIIYLSSKRPKIVQSHAEQQLKWYLKWS